MMTFPRYLGRGRKGSAADGFDPAAKEPPAPLFLGVDALLTGSRTPTANPLGGLTRQDVEELSDALMNRAEWLTALSAEGVEVAHWLRRSMGVGGPLHSASVDLLDMAEEASSAARQLRRLAPSLPLAAPELPLHPRRAGAVVIELREEVRHRLRLEHYTQAMLAEDLAAIGYDRSCSRITKIETDREPIPPAMLLALKLLRGILELAGTRPSDPAAGDLRHVSRRVYSMLHGPVEPAGEVQCHS